MSVVIKINNVDRTSLIDWETFRFDQAITHQIDTVNFTIKRHAGKTFKPALLDDVEILENAVKRFGGKITGNEETIDGRVQFFEVTCKDHSHEMDSRRVVRVFENTTVDAVIESIKDDFLPAGFTTNGVTVTNVVNFVAFNYEQPTKCFQQLAELTGADWFVDEDKDIKFFAKSELTAPFELTDTSEKFFWNSLVLRQDVKNLRNIIFVRGGEFEGDSFTEEQEADGETKVFVQGFRYSNIVVKVNTVAKTVGIDNKDDPGSFDVLYNFDEKALKFPSPLTVSDVLDVTGNPHIPVIIKTKDNASITEFGEFEHKIIDKSINSKEGARDRAKGEVIAWAATMNEGNFSTIESGLRVGQQIRINSVIRGVDKFYHISRINTTMRDPNTFVHDVTLMSQRTWGMVEFLQDQLIKKDKEIVISQDEVLDKIETALESIVINENIVQQITTQLSETITIGEVVAAPVLFTPPYKWAPNALPARLRWGLGVWS